MSERQDNHIDNKGIQEIFPHFHIPEQQKRLEHLFQILNDEIQHNPDIQKLGITIFSSENNFFDWYLSSTNRGPQYGIPDGISKIDILKKLQNISPKLIKKGIYAIDGDEKDFYKELLQYNTKNDLCIENKTIPLLFSDKNLNKYIDYLEAGIRNSHWA